MVFGLIGWMENNRIDAMNLKFKKYDQVFHAVHLTAFGEVLTGSGSARVSRSPEGVSLDGSSKGEVSDSSSPIFFTGKIFDSGLQAYHFLYRNYSPTQARWTAADPSGFPDGPNQWLYVNNSVTGAVDPLGLSSLKQDSKRETISLVGGSSKVAAAGVDALGNISNNPVIVAGSGFSGAITQAIRNKINAAIANAIANTSFTDVIISGSVKTDVSYQAFHDDDNNGGWSNESIIGATQGPNGAVSGAFVVGGSVSYSVNMSVSGAHSAGSTLYAEGPPEVMATNTLTGAVNIEYAVTISITVDIAGTGSFSVSGSGTRLGSAQQLTGTVSE